MIFQIKHDRQLRPTYVTRGSIICFLQDKLKWSKIGLSETVYPAFSGSNTINSCVYFVELLSVKSLVIHDSRAEVHMIHDSASTPDF